MISLCGEVKLTKSVIGNRHLKSSFDETVMAQFEAESGATIEISCSITHNSPFRLELHASKATLIGYDLAGDNQKIFINNKEMLFSKNNPYLSQIENFVKAITHNIKPEVSLDDGLKNVETIIRISNESIQHEEYP